jgi:hypothetical protein
MWENINRAKSGAITMNFVSLQNILSLLLHCVAQDLNSCIAYRFRPLAYRHDIHHSEYACLLCIALTSS